MSSTASCARGRASKARHAVPHGPCQLRYGAEAALEKEPGMTVVIGQCRPDCAARSTSSRRRPASSRRSGRTSCRPSSTATPRSRACRSPARSSRIPRCRSTSPTRTCRARTSTPTTNGSISPAAPGRRPITSSAPARWAAIRWRWSTTGCACTASRACASSMPRSCRPCPRAIPMRRRSWSPRRAPT